MSYYGMYNSGDPTHQYYTLSLINPPKSDSTDTFPINYEETRNSPFLKDPQSYYVSVIRFTCTTPLLPIFIPAIKDQATNETEYSITMHHPALGTIRRHIFFESVNPYVQRSVGNTSSEYYYIYQPNDWIAQVNKVLTDVWLALGATPVGTSPFIEWLDSTSVGKLWVNRNLCQSIRPGVSTTSVTAYPASTAHTATAASVVSGFLTVTLSAVDAAKYLINDSVDIAGFTPAGNNTSAGFPVKIREINGTTLTLDKVGVGPITVLGTITANTPIAIYMNASLFNLFSSFTAENQATVLNPAPKDGTHWKFIIAPTYDSATWPTDYQLPQYGPQPRNPTPAPPTLPVYTYISQQYSTLPLWNPVSSFVFTTSILPINPENLSIPTNVGSALRNGGNNSAIGTVLTDFEIPLEVGFESKPTITYAPNAEYRLVDLNGNSDCRSIQISIGWRDRRGVFNPLNIGPNGFAQIKLLFRKRDYNGT